MIGYGAYEDTGYGELGSFEAEPGLGGIASVAGKAKRASKLDDDEEHELSGFSDFGRLQRFTGEDDFPLNGCSVTEDVYDIEEPEPCQFVLKGDIDIDIGDGRKAKRHPDGGYAYQPPVGGPKGRCDIVAPKGSMPPPPPPKNNLPLIIGGAVLVAVVGGFLFWKSQQKET